MRTSGKSWKERDIRYSSAALFNSSNSGSGWQISNNFFLWLVFCESCFCFNNAFNRIWCIYVQNLVFMRVKLCNDSMYRLTLHWKRNWKGWGIGKWYFVYFNIFLMKNATEKLIEFSMKTQHSYTEIRFLKSSFIYVKVCKSHST